MYGKELILDLHECSTDRFNEQDIQTYFDLLCDLIDMVQVQAHFWTENEGEDHLIGTSAVQFIQTSNVTIHTIEKMRNVYLNIFSCKDFDAEAAEKFSKDYFKGTTVNKAMLIRK